jgi:hypothetical protein
MERHETGEQKAEELVRSGLKQLHWTQADLETRPKGDNARSSSPKASEKKPS